MIRTISNLIVVLLVYFLITGSSAQNNNNNSLEYKVVSHKVFDFYPNSSKTYIDINTTAYLQPESSNGNVLAIGLRDSVITVQNENSKVINVTDCLSQDTVAAFETTFLAVYNDSGVLDYIVVKRDEPELSVNIKLLAAALLQIDKEQVRTLSPAVTKRPELFYTGSCPSTSIITGKENPVSLTKQLNLDQCTDVINNHRSDSLACLNNTCRPTNFNWLGKTDVVVTKPNNQTIINNIVLTEVLKYNPFNQSDTELRFDGRIEANLIGNAMNVISPITAGTNYVVQEAVYPAINKTICGSNGNNNKELKELYSALICELAFAVFYKDIIEIAIACNGDN